MAVVVETVAMLDPALDAADGEVHLGQPPGRVVGFLPVDRDVVLRPAAVAGRMRADEVDGLHEHAGRTAAGIVNPAPVRLDHLHQQPDHAARGVELAALLALGAGELRQEIFVDAAEHVPRAGLRIPHPDIAYHVDELPEPLLVERLAGVILRQHILERRVVALDGGHRTVDDLADDRLPRLRLEMAPAGVRRYPEDVLREILVAVLGSLRAPFGQDRGMALLEGVGDVLEEDQPEDDMLVFRGVHRAAQRIGHRPQFGLVAGRGAMDSGGAAAPRFRLPRSSPGHASPSGQMSLHRPPGTFAGERPLNPVPWLNRPRQPVAHRRTACNRLPAPCDCGRRKACSGADEVETDSGLSVAPINASILSAMRCAGSRSCSIVQSAG